MVRTADSRLRVTFVMLALLLVTTWLYAPALDFGFIWDDPQWFGRVAEGSLSTLIGPTPDFQFYRPGTFLYNRLFLRPDGTFPAPLMHAAQIGWHLLNVALVYALSRRLGLRRWTAVAVSGLIAWHPLAHQSVVWAAPQQPLAAVLQNGTWLTYLIARRQQKTHYGAYGLSLLLYFLALTVQESAVVVAAVPLLMEWVVRRRGTSSSSWRLALVYPMIAAAYGLLWLWVPRQSGYTALTFESSVVLYFLQGLVFPWLGRPSGYAPDPAPSQAVLLALTALTVGALLAAARYAGRLRPALFGLVWAMLAVTLPVVGLRYSYVELSPRLFYTACQGVALLWASALLPVAHGSPLRRWWRSGRVVLLSLIVLQSALLLRDFHRLYAVGTAHLAELIQAAPATEARLLMVNFPDRYAPKRPPYPLGYWGVVLAPVSVDLGAFPAVVVGRHPDILSYSMPWIDAQARADGPYQIDLRGEITPPEQLYQLAHQADGVGLSHYRVDGTFALQWAGSVTATTAPVADLASNCRMAIFGRTLCLQAAQIEAEPRQLDLTLSWLSLSQAQPHDTIFAHLAYAPEGQPLLAQADGDAWLEMLPLSVWQPGDTIRERRIISLPDAIPPGRYSIRLGVYNRLSGERLPATTPQGQPLPDNAITVGYFP